MAINTKQDWIDLAKLTAPKLPEYMAEFGNVDQAFVSDALTDLVLNEDWKALHGWFENIWAWLPDNPSIRVHPFGDLCDLCSEVWAINEAEE